MILTAATGVGLCGIEAYLVHFWEVSLRALVTRPLKFEPLEIAHRVELLMVPTVAMLTITLIALRFRGPRARFRRLARQPGFVACWAAALGLLVVACLVTGEALATDRFTFILDDYALLVFAEVFPGLAVLASWLTLATTGAWHSEPDWIDRFGRALGVLWLLLAIMGPILLLTQP